MSKTIGIIGSRRRNTEADYRLVAEAFGRIYSPGDTIISGGCPQGGDHFAERIAEIESIPIIIKPARWDIYGRSAGFARNTDIARESDVLIACVAPDRTGGTEDTIKKFHKFMKPDIGQLILV